MVVQSQQRSTCSRLPWAIIVGVVLVATACGDAVGSGADLPSPATTAATDSAPGPADAVTSSTTTSDSMAPPLVGSHWNVIFFSLGDSMTNPWPGTQLTISFGQDGRVSGSSGCNTYGASYETVGGYDEFEEGVPDVNDGQELRLGLVAVTEMACESPSNVMEQEIEFLDAFVQTGRWVVIRGNLHLRTVDGSFLLEAEPLD